MTEIPGDLLTTLIQLFCYASRWPSLHTDSIADCLWLPFLIKGVLNLTDQGVYNTINLETAVVSFFDSSSAQLSLKEGPEGPLFF